MRDVQQAVISSGEHAGGEGVARIDFRESSTRAAGGVEDLDSEFTGDVVAADFVNGHAIAFGHLDIWRSFAEFEFTFLFPSNSMKVNITMLFEQVENTVWVIVNQK